VKCVSNLLAVGFRRFDVDVYWDTARGIWSLCPASLGPSNIDQRIAREHVNVYARQVDSGGSSLTVPNTVTQLDGQTVTSATTTISLSSGRSLMALVS
jgi:hypothetical protein